MWVFDNKTNFLTFEKTGYGFDLATKNTSAKLLDLILQVSKKHWASDSILSDLIRKLDALFDIQKNICSFGRDKSFDVFEHLKRSQSGFGK